ncbi:MAG: hypothetical protein HY927_03045 [Elusimicrobia bacterium]|nr:hypothetical protein [Elusimicrobiota bacterium]
MRTTAVALALALVAASPGLTPYRAWAQVVLPVSVEAPVGGVVFVPTAGGASAQGSLPVAGRTSGMVLSSGLTGLKSVLPVALPQPAVTAAVEAPLASPSPASFGLPASPAGAAERSEAAPAPAGPSSLSLPDDGAQGRGLADLEAAAPGASPAVPSDVSDGALPASVLGEPKSLGRRFQALRRLFSSRRAEALPSSGPAPTMIAAPLADGRRTAGVLSAPEAEPDARPTPAPTTQVAGRTAQDPKAASSWLGLGSVAVFFILGLIFAQIGVEALGASLPALMEKAFGDVTKLAEITIFASVTGIIGRTLGTLSVERFGLKKTYLASTALRVVAISALAGLLATSHMTWPLMIVFYSISGLLGGIAMTAESSIPPAIYGSDQVRLEKFWTWQQTLLEIVGVAAPIATGAVVASLGFLPALIAFPVSFAVAIVIMLLTLKIPAKVGAMKLADAQAAREAGARGKSPAGFAAAFKGFFGKMARGAKVVWKTPLLRTAFLAFTAFMVLNPLLYTMLAPNFGMRLIGPQNENLYTSVIGMLTGLYSLGGLLGGFLMMAEQRKVGALKAGAAQEGELMRRSMLRWMKWGTLGLAAIATMAFPIPMLGALAALPSWLSWLGTLTLPAVALIPFGIAQVVSTVKLKSYFQSQTPQADMADAMGFFGSASLAVSTVGILALKYLFKGMAGFAPFTVIALAMIPLAIGYLYLTRKLDRLSRPS